jgi:hypothetical protein
VTASVHVTGLLRSPPAPLAADDPPKTGAESTGDGVQDDHPGQHHREHHQGRAALPVAVGACVHKSGNADEKCNSEDHPAGLGEP